MPELPENHIGANVGSVMYSDSIYHSVLFKDSEIVFDVHYSIDRYHKRITPDHSSERNKYALFFGCSIAFGEGLEDNQTFPFYFQKVSDEFNSYNFGTSGHGTNHMLAKLQFQDLSAQVDETDGAAFYIFFWDHIYRSIGTMSRYTDWLQNAPYYKMKDGKLVRDKMFYNGRFFISTIYQLIHQSSIIKFYELDFPVKLNDSHFDLVTEMILESKKEYQTQFGNDNFYVISYPAYRAYTDQEFLRFKKYLADKHIDFIDLNEELTYSPEHTLGGDPHPNAKTNEFLAKVLYEKIKLESASHTSRQ